MRLMVGDVEVPQAEGEVDRVDVFERRCEKQQVRRDVGANHVQNLTRKSKGRAAKGNRGLLIPDS
jgi:hypothetical protein